MMLITTMLTDKERVNTVAVSATVYYSFRENKNNTTVSRFASFCLVIIITTCAVPHNPPAPPGNLGSLIHKEILQAYHV